MVNSNKRENFATIKNYFEIEIFFIFFIYFRREDYVRNRDITKAIETKITLILITNISNIFKEI